MGKKPKRKNLKPPGKCIFCGQTGLSKTHIWPEWLGRLLPVADSRDEEFFQLSASVATEQRHILELRRRKQGGVFSLKPRIACEGCNTGWMADFEHDMANFAKPIFTTNTAYQLNEKQIKTFSGWISLITVLADYLPANNNTIALSDIMFLKRHRFPPDHWSIFYCSLNSHQWRQKYKKHSIGIYPGSLSPILLERANTQVTSFGIGKLFVHVFVCPVDRLVTDFRIASKSKGLSQLWPITTPLWPFTKRAAKFPTKLVLDDAEADVVADAFHERLRIMLRIGHERHQPPY